MHELKISYAENVSAGRSTIENVAQFAAGAAVVISAPGIAIVYADAGIPHLGIALAGALEFAGGYAMGDAIEDQFGLGAALGDLAGRTVPELFTW